MFFDPPAADVESRAAGAAVRYGWLTPERQTQVRGVLLGLTLFFGLTVWIWHSLGAAAPDPSVFVRKLREKLDRRSRFAYVHTHYGVGYRFGAEVRGSDAA